MKRTQKALSMVANLRPQACPLKFTLYRENTAIPQPDLMCSSNTD